MHQINCINRSSLSYSLNCPLNNCFRQFKKYDTFYKHVKKDHSEIYNRESSSKERRFVNDTIVNENDIDINDGNGISLKIQQPEQ